MTKSEAITVLRANSDRIRELGATGMYLFGSAARDELTAESDIDLFIDYDPAGVFSFVEFIRLRELIGSRLGREVDLSTRDGLHPLLKSEIERSSIRIL